MAAEPTAAEPDPNLHLYLLIGQSNMAGRGKVDGESKKTHPRVLVLAKDLTWQVAADPLHFDSRADGVGPGLTFGKILAGANPQVKIGLVPCAVGGTPIKNWKPGRLDPATNTHPYDDMLQRMKAAQKAGVLKGIIWHQGESDYEDNPKYGKMLAELIAQLRADLHASDVPFVAGELTPFHPLDGTNTANIANFNAVVQGLSQTVKQYACVRADGLGDKGDKLHYHADAARELGKRYAEKMLALQARQDRREKTEPPKP